MIVGFVFSLSSCSEDKDNHKCCIRPVSSYFSSYEIACEAWEKLNNYYTEKLHYSFDLDIPELKAKVYPYYCIAGMTSGRNEYIPFRHGWVINCRSRHLSINYTDYFAITFNFREKELPNLESFEWILKHDYTKLPQSTINPDYEDVYVPWNTGASVKDRTHEFCLIDENRICHLDIITNAFSDEIFELYKDSIIEQYIGVLAVS